MSKFREMTPEIIKCEFWDSQRHFPSPLAHCLFIKFNNFYLRIPQLVRIEDNSIIKKSSN